jgi:hypothetical protein
VGNILLEILPYLGLPDRSNSKAGQGRRRVVRVCVAGCILFIQFNLFYPFFFLELYIDNNIYVESERNNRDRRTKSQNFWVNTTFIKEYRNLLIHVKKEGHVLKDPKC